MGAIRQTPTGNWELAVRNKRLLGDGVRLFFTYDTEADALEDSRLIDAAFADGKLPRLVQEKLKSLAAGKSNHVPRTQGHATVGVVIRAWIANGHIAPTDEAVLVLLRAELGEELLSSLTYEWAESWVRKMKQENNYAPGTIRKRIGSLSRCLDWWLRKHPALVFSNPLKLLPRGASTYNARDAREVTQKGGKAKRDEIRDRRLRPGELARITKALAGEKRPDRERPLLKKDGEAFPMLFWLIYFTGMRLREAYMVERAWIDLERAVIDLKCSKQWYGREKWRKVPIRPELLEKLRGYLATLPAGAGGRVFPFVEAPQPTPAELTRVTNRLTRRFESLYDYANCEGITEHDLRHEATCQWYELRAPDGNWLFRESEIEKIMGWEPGSPMPSRYASFRAEDLAQRLYQATTG